MTRYERFNESIDDLKIIDTPKKNKSHAEAARLLAIVERAGPLRLTQDAASIILRTGARHNAGDNTLIQQAHDILCSLGASCACEQVDALRQYGEPNLQLMSAIKAAVKRDYKKEYRDYHGKPEQVKRRSGRNQARRAMVKAGKVKPGDGKDVDHINRDTTDNAPGNLRAMDRSKNRSRK